MRWVSERDLAESGMRLFCLPHAGSGAAGYYRWKRLLPGSIAVCPVMLPGREVRLNEPPMTSVREIVGGLHRELRGELERPYAIFGHSMSSLLAFEWARLIERDGLRAPEVLFVSGRSAPRVGADARAFHKLPDREMVKALAATYGGDVELLLEEPELAAVYLPIVRADVTVVETYSYAPGEVLRCPVRAFAGEEDSSVSEEGLLRWGSMTMGEFEARRFDGGHFYHLGVGQGELVRVLAEECRG